MLNNEGLTFKSENFSQKSLEGQVFNACTFNGCNFTESILRNVEFCDCEFVNCNLSLAKMDGSRFQDVKFKECKIVGVDFYKCNSAFFSPNFKDCMLQYCNFSDLVLKYISFKGCTLKECHFNGTNLSGAAFIDTEFNGTLFHKCDLSKADLTSARGYDIDPRTNKVTKAKFSLPEAARLLQFFDITLV